MLERTFAARRENADMKHPKSISRRSTILIFALGCLLTFTLAYREKSAVERRSRELAAQSAHRVTARLRLTLAREGAICESVAAFFAASEFVSAEEFRTFAGTLLSHDSEIQAVEWASRVREADRRDWEQTTNIEIVEKGLDGALRRADRRQEFAPILYVEPRAGNDGALGLDLLSESTRRAALGRAAAEYQCIATAPIRLVQDETTALLLAAPLASAATDAAADPGAHAIDGWAIVVFKGNDLTSQLSALDRQSVAVTDVTDPVRPVVFLAGSDTSPRSRRDVHTEQLEMLGRTWRVDYACDGSTGWQAFLLTALLGLVVTALLTSHFDATRRIYNRREELAQKNDEIERRNREIRSFYHAVSHELKTPLASAREFASLIRDEVAGPVTPEQREFGEYILESCDQMTRYVNDMLDVSRIETGKFTIEPSWIGVADLIKQPACAAVRTCQEKGVQFALQLEAGLPQVHVDAQRIQQALTNLLVNAAKFTKPGGAVRLCVQLGRSGGKVEFQIHDTGVGIAPQDQAWIFERLRQAPTETAARGVDGGGLGLGLAITREIVQLHDGTIELDSEIGVGTVFTIRIPLGCRGWTAATSEPETKPEPETEPKPTPEPEPVLSLL